MDDPDEVPFEETSLAQAEAIKNGGDGSALATLVMETTGVPAYHESSISV